MCALLSSTLYLCVAYSVYARGFFCVWPTVQDTLAVCGVTVWRTSFPSTVSRVIDSDVLARSALVASLLSKLTCGLYTISHCVTVAFSGLV